MKAIARYITYSILVMGMFACQKTPPVKRVVSIHTANAQPLADGSSTDSIYADLPIDALPTNLGVTFRASSGLFDNGFDTMSVFASRIDVTPKKITAVVNWHASVRSGLDTLYASTSTIPQFTDNLTLNLLPSAAASIQLAPSSFTLKDTFGMQVKITGLLSNDNGGFVSSGAKVEFFDLTDAGASAGGSFVPQIAGINDSSQVSTIYFPALLSPGAITGIYITIKAVVLDSNSNPTGPSSTTKIYISP